MSKFYVHRNLTKQCWSVLYQGKVCNHRKELTLKQVEFKVRSGGYSRYLKEKTRNVHAFVVGRLSKGVPQGRGVRIRYDLDCGKFVDLKGKAYTQAKAVRLDKYGKVWGFGLKK